GAPPAHGAADAAALVRRAVDLATARPADAPAADAAESPGVDAAEQPAAAGETDGAARAGRFLDALADRIALGVASVAAVLDPGCVVLGGEIGQAGGDVLAARVEQRVARLSPLRTEVRAGALGGTAVLRGALLTARDSAQEDLFTPPGAMLDSPQARTC
ncbi:ROK family protein, partial [Streptomyces mexicanus]|uniref:ROK family protein n=1 Tax=Streptomyces mexicanus TaxID=178566 RepID=UPI0031ED2A54